MKVLKKKVAGVRNIYIELEQKDEKIVGIDDCSEEELSEVNVKQKAACHDRVWLCLEKKWWGL